MKLIKIIRTLICSFAIISLMSLSAELNAQVTIGAEIEPNNGALLDLKEKNPINPSVDNSTTNKGLGMPRVKLTSLVTLTDIKDAVGKEKELTGLFVYNVNTNNTLGIRPGLYVWDGSCWRPLIFG